jgi:hypothetical protein
MGLDILAQPVGTGIGQGYDLAEAVSRLRMAVEEAGRRGADKGKGQARGVCARTDMRIWVRTRELMEKIYATHRHLF